MMKSLPLDRLDAGVNQLGRVADQADRLEQPVQRGPDIDPWMELPARRALRPDPRILAD